MYDKDMQNLLDDIRTEMDTLKGCIGRMEQRLDELQAKLAELSGLLQSGPKPHVAEEVPPQVVEEPVVIPSQPEVVQETRQPVEEPAEEPLSASILAERIRPAADLRHALSLNDSFRFARELFDGNASRMNRVLESLSHAATFAEAVSLFEAEVHATEDNEAAADFIELLRKYFN